MIVKAVAKDHLPITQLTKRSKAHWGYTQAQMQNWDDELTITPAYIKDNWVFIWRDSDQILAYYSYYFENEHCLMLDNLFVDPLSMKQGIGKKMMHDFLAKARLTKVSTIKLFADPHAESFYLPFGFVTTGQFPTKVHGRFLPIMIKQLI